MEFLTPTILASAPNGAYRTQADHPALPVTADDIVATAAACHEAGAVMLHLHVRDAEQRHLLDDEAYRDVTERVRTVTGDGMIVQITTEAGGRYEPPAQLAVVRAVRPEVASVAVREVAAAERDVPDYADFLRWASDAGVAVQHILYSAEDAARFTDLRTRGVIPGERPFLLFVIGRRDDHATSAAPLLAALAEVEDCSFMVCGFGPVETTVAVAAAALGGHARIGFENSLWNPDGTPARDNAERIGVVRQALEMVGGRIGTDEDLREVLRLAR